MRRVGVAFAAFNVAEWATWIAMLVYAYDHGGVVASGAVAVAQLVPAALVAPFAATLADRYRRERVLAGGYLAQAIAFAATALAIATEAPVLVVYALAAVGATFVTLTRPSQSALVPALATTHGMLIAANGALAAVENASILIAPLIAGALLALSGAALVYAAMAAALLLAFVVVVGMNVPTTPREASPPRIGPRAAFAELARDRTAMSLVALLAAESIGIGATDVLFVALALGVLGTGAAGVGILNAALGAGGVAGAVLASRALSRSLPGGAIVGTLAWSVGLAALAFANQAWSAVVIVLAAGAGRSVMDVAGRTILQRIARADVLSGVFGILEGLSMAALAVGSLLAPALVEVYGIPSALVAIGAVAPAVLLFAVPAILRARHALANGLADADADARSVTNELIEEGPR